MLCVRLAGRFMSSLCQNTSFTDPAPLSDLCLRPYRCNNPNPPPPPYEVRGSFEMVTLDQALYCPYKEHRRKVAAVKIDVESHEMFVIRGGRRFFEDMQVCVSIDMTWQLDEPD